MAGQDYQNIVVARTDWRLDITFNRPDRRNALTHTMMEEIGAAVHAVKDDGEIRAVVLRGAGGYFCAGGDLDAMADMPPPPGPGETDPLIAPYRYFGYVLEELNRLPQAVIAVVEGPAAGGGFGMACCADVVITHEDAKYGMPEPRVGFIPSQIIPYVVRRIGEGAARRMAVMGITANGREAVELGIAHYCCTDEAELASRLEWVLGEVRRCEPQALATVKRLVLDCEAKPDAAICDDAAESLIGLLRRPTAVQGIDAFMAKRRPPWAG